MDGQADLVSNILMFQAAFRKLVPSEIGAEMRRVLNGNSVVLLLENSDQATNIHAIFGMPLCVGWTGVTYYAMDREPLTEEVHARTSELWRQCQEN